MDICYDPAKSAENVARRNLSFEAARNFELSDAVIAEDVRQMYPERRFQALGYIDGKLYMLVFTPSGRLVRVISLRRANFREARRHEQAKDK
jgi:uncharacterized DUF497 family protein